MKAQTGAKERQPVSLNDQQQTALAELTRQTPAHWARRATRDATR